MTAYQTSGDHIASEVVDGELIVLNLLVGTYYSSLGAGKTLWSALVGGADMAVVIPFLAARSIDAAAFGTAAAAMIATFVADGVLVERIEAAPFDIAAISAALPSDPLVPPSIEAHQDMEDLLMLDPIHDVGDAGWPVRPDTGAPR